MDLKNLETSVNLALEGVLNWIVQEEQLIV
jgi:hypothetical protein